METPDNNSNDAPRASDDTPPPPAPAASIEASYFEKLLAYIPADMVAGYLAIDGILKQSMPDVTLWIYWAVTAAMLLLTPLYIRFKPGPKSILSCSTRFKTVAGTLAFAVWVFALGGPFAVTFPWYRPVFGSLLLIVTTLAIPVFEKIAEKYKI